MNDETTNSEAAEEERWAPAKGFGYGLEVSSFGNVRRTGHDVFRFWNGRCMIERKRKETTPHFSKNRNRMIVQLRVNGKQKTMTLAPMVADAFVPNPKGAGFLRYRDGDPHNCRADNLEWVVPTQGEGWKEPHTMHLDPIELPGEEWRHPDGIDAGYEVSNFGRVRRIQRTIVHHTGTVQVLSPMILKYQKASRGMPVVEITRAGKRRHRSPAILVAKAFLPRPGPLTRLVHVNGNIWDNRTANLAWIPTREARNIEKRVAARAFKATVGDPASSSSERWAPVPGYAGAFEVSDGGNVRSAGREVPHRFGTLFKKSQILRTPVQSNKRTVVLRENGRIHLHFVDRLIAAAFIPNPGHATRVRHLDGDSMNDRADNLAWVEPGASGKNGRVKRKLGKRERAIPVIVEDGNGNRALLSTTLKCVRLLGISVHYVRRVVAGKDATIAGLRIRRAVREDLSAMTPDKQEDLAPLREWTRGRPRVPPRKLVVATPPSGPAFLLPSAKEAARAAGVPLSTMYQILQGVFPSPAGWTFRRATEADMELWRPTEDGPCGS